MFSFYTEGCNNSCDGLLSWFYQELSSKTTLSASLNISHHRWRQPCFLINAFHGLSQHIVNRNFASTTFYFFGVISGRPRTDVGNWLMCCWAVELPWPFCLRIEDKGSAKFISSWEGCQRDAAVGKEGQEGTDGPLLNICHFPLKKEHLLILWVEGLWVTSKLTEPNFWLWSSHGHSPVLREKKKKHSKLLSILQTLASRIPPHAIRVILAKLRRGQGMLFWVPPPPSQPPPLTQPCFPRVLHSPCTLTPWYNIQLHDFTSHLLLDPCLEWVLSIGLQREVSRATTEEALYVSYWAR